MSKKVGNMTALEFIQKHGGKADTWEFGENKYISLKHLHWIIDKLFDKTSKETSTYTIPYGDALYDLEKEVKKAFIKPKKRRWQRNE